MKNILSLGLIFFLVLSTFSLQGQDFRCSTDQSDEFMIDLMRNKKDWDKTRLKSLVDRFVPVQFHTISDNSGANTVSETSVNLALCELNERYDSLGIYFYMVAPINKIFSTAVNNSVDTNHGFLIDHKDERYMNIFFGEVPRVELLTPTSFVAGYYSRHPDEDFIVVRNGNIADGVTLEHEVGHFFTLAHTHRGWESEPYDRDVHGDTVTILTVGSSQSAALEVELVDGSNCGNFGWTDPIAGDGICDTPPDYGFGQACRCCTIGNDVFDRNGDLIEPMINNIMSYSDNCGEWVLSPDQIIAVQSSYFSSRRAYLRNNNTVTEYTPIDTTATLLLPENTAVIAAYDRVTLSWEAVPNAEEYIVRIDGTIADEIRTTETELVLTNLKPNGNYLWSVTAVNKFGYGCIGNIVGRIFFTGNETTSVKELEEVTGLRIFPNPASSGDVLRILFDSEKSFNADLKLISLNGQLIAQKTDNRIVAGDNRMRLDLNNVSSGVYLLELISEQGIKIEKIIIE